MGNHIRNGKFESDKYVVVRLRDGVCVTADKLVLSFNDPRALCAIKVFANMTNDADLAIDLKTRLRAVEAEIFLARAKGELP